MFVQTSHVWQITGCQSSASKRSALLFVGHVNARVERCASHLELNFWVELRHLHLTHVTEVLCLFTSVQPRCQDVPREVLSFQSLRATSNPREQKRQSRMACAPGTLRSASLFSQGATKQPRFQGVAGKRIFAPSIARRNLGSDKQRLQLGWKMSPEKSWTPSPGKAQ